MSEFLSLDRTLDTTVVLGSVGQMLLTLCPVILLYCGFRLLYSLFIDQRDSCDTLLSIFCSWLWKKVLQPCFRYLNKTIFTPCFQYLKRKFIEYLES